MLMVSGRDNGNGSPVASPGIKFNNDGGSNLSQRRIYADNPGATSANSSSLNVIYEWYVTGSAATSNTFGYSSIYVPNYVTSVAKSFSIDTAYENNSNTPYMGFTAGLWNQTAAITTITLLASSTWSIGSTFSLYGVSNSGATGASVS
jgi:hypothetical protein